METLKLMMSTVKLLFNLKYGTIIRRKTYQANWPSYSSQRIPMDHLSRDHRSVDSNLISGTINGGRSLVTCPQKLVQV